MRITAVLLTASVALFGNTLVAETVIVSQGYGSVGNISTKIASTFQYYHTFSKTACLSTCMARDCKLVGWGAAPNNQTECRVMTGSAVPVDTTMSFVATTTQLTIYAPLNHSYDLVQHSTGFFVRRANPTDWNSARSYCRSLGLPMYSPPTLDSMRAHLSVYGRFWTGTSDVSVEGTYVNEEGISVPPGNGMYCPNEPNNANNIEDCIEATSSPGCYNDGNCAGALSSFCQIGI